MDRYYGELARDNMKKAECELLKAQEHYERGKTELFLKEALTRTISSIRNQMKYILAHLEDEK